MSKACGQCRHYELHYMGYDLLPDMGTCTCLLPISCSAFALQRPSISGTKEASNCPCFKLKMLPLSKEATDARKPLLSWSDCGGKHE